MIDKKDLGGLVRPSLDVNSVVNVADKLLTQMIKETNITLQKNIIQKIQIGTLKVVHEKKKFLITFLPIQMTQVLPIPIKLHF